MYRESKELDAQVLKMGFEKSNISLLIILPKAKDGLSTLETKISQVTFQTIFGDLKEQKVDVKIPKFKIEFNVKMNNPLKNVRLLKLDGYTDYNKI